MDKFPELSGMVDSVFVDNMENDFILSTGAWPEGYFFTDKNGIATWKCTAVKDQTCNDFL